MATTGIAVKWLRDQLGIIQTASEVGAQPEQRCDCKPHAYCLSSCSFLVLTLHVVDYTNASLRYFISPCNRVYESLMGILPLRVDRHFGCIGRLAARLLLRACLLGPLLSLLAKRRERVLINLLFAGLFNNLH